MCVAASRFGTHEGAAPCRNCAVAPVPWLAMRHLADEQGGS